MARAGLAAAARALDRFLADDDVGRRRLNFGRSDIIQGPPQRGLSSCRIDAACGLDAVDVGPLHGYLCGNQPVCRVHPRILH